MKFEFGENRGVVLGAVVVVLLGVLHDFVGAVAAMYRWALTPYGQPMLLVGVAVVVIFLAVERFATPS